MSSRENPTPSGSFKERYHIITFGCQMNEHDSEKIAGMLAREGYRTAAAAEESDLIILNTCSVREKPEQKVFSRLGRLRPLKKKNPQLVIAVCGCVAQRMKEGIRERAPYVDLVFGTQNLERLPDLLRQVRYERTARCEIVEERATPTDRGGLVRQNPFKAWVTITEGCDNYCTYCVVPYVRGHERSRPSAEITKEACTLGEDGVEEITLLGQNVNSYGRDRPGEIGFSELLYNLDEVPGISRIRFVTSHPKDFTPALVRAMRDLPKVCEQIHLPVQAGSNRILKAMNRRYTREEYLEKVEMLRREVPGVEIGSDIIVAFPGETEEDFAQTLDLLERVRFDSIFSFIYSDREPVKDKIKAPRLPRDIALSRFERLWELQNRINLEKNRALAGQEAEVLVEGVSKGDASLLTGRTRSNRLVHFAAEEELIGAFALVEITGAGKHSLRGRLLSGKTRQTPQHPPG